MLQRAAQLVGALTALGAGFGAAPALAAPSAYDTAFVAAFAEACIPGRLSYEATEAAVAKQSACRLTVGETLDAPGVYDLARGARDRVLTRRPDLEAQFGV